MSKNENVRFIRRNGRVIPIRVKGGFKSLRQKRIRHKMKESKKLAAQSAGFTLAGIVSSLFAGSSIKKSLKKADKFSQQSFDFLNEKRSRLPKGVKSVGQGFEIAGKMRKRSVRIRQLGQVAGGALLSQGVQRALRSQGVKIDDPIIDVGAEAGSQVASALIARKVRSSFSKKSSFGFKAPIAVKKLAKDLTVRFVKKQTRFKF